MDKKQEDFGYNLNSLKESYHNFSLDESKKANDIISKTHNYFLLICLAELTYLAQILFKFEGIIRIFIKIEIALILVTFIFFLIGSITQFHFILGVSKKLDELVTKVAKYMKEKKTLYVKELPEELSMNDYSGIDKKSNLFFKISIVLFLSANILMLIQLIFFL